MRYNIDAWRRRKRYVRVKSDRKLAVVDTGGERPAAVLLHGYTDTSRSYQVLATHLDGWRLVIPDLPGHGDSDEDPKVELTTLVEDMSALADLLEIAPLLMIGHSFGSLLALEIARRNIWPEVNVVLLAGSACPALRGLETLKPIKAFGQRVDPLDPFLDYWYAGPGALDRQFLEDVRAEAVSMPVRIWHRYRGLLERSDIRNVLGTIDSPILSISGGRDQLFDARHADVLSRGLPCVRDVRLFDRGHNLHWEAPEQIAGLTAEWLTSGIT